MIHMSSETSIRGASSGPDDNGGGGEVVVEPTNDANPGRTDNDSSAPALWKNPIETLFYVLW